MAKKQTAQTDVETTQEQQDVQVQAQEQQASIQVQPSEIYDHLPQHEKNAIQEIEASEGTGKSYRLANPFTQYTDTRNQWTLTGDQSKPLPKHPTQDTYERIKQGFLVEGPTVTEFPQFVQEGTE